MIDGRTQLVGIVGWPVDHSFSPVMHNAAFDALGFNWRYVPLPVPPGHVLAAVRGLAAMGFRGANLTVPHKQAVLPALDEVDPGAAALGAVNTLVFSRSATGAARITGHNTDASGFSEALKSGGVDIAERTRAVVVGAGGAARAVIFALVSSHAGEITVFSRTPARADALVADLSRRDAATRLAAEPLTDDHLLASAETADLLVNATPVGMWPRHEDSIWPEGRPVPGHLTVFDLVYNPIETRLLAQARDSGARGLGGLEMLVQQGALAFELWTGRLAPVKAMRAACQGAGRRQTQCDS